MRRSLLALALSVSALPAFAAVHTWTGAASNLVSDSANWSGGSPVGDDAAELVFPNDAAHFDVWNDVEGLRFAKIGLEGYDYMLAGRSLQTVDGVISGLSGSQPKRIYCDIDVSGSLTVSADSLAFYGAIRGSGALNVYYGTAELTGDRPNTFTGDVTLNAGVLRLSKTNGAAGVLGAIRSVASSSSSTLAFLRPDQKGGSAFIADAPGTNIGLFADATIPTLLLRGSVNSGVPKGQPIPTLTVDSLQLPENQLFIEVRTNLRLRQSVLEIPAGTSFTVGSYDAERAQVGDGGITLQGAGGVSWAGDYTAPTRVNVRSAGVKVPKSPVTITGGYLQGTVGSLTATAGRLGQITSLGDVRLAPGVTVASTIALNGVLDLGGATLDILPPVLSDPRPIVIIKNDSSQPVVGTFAGVADGSVALGRWRISYHGGDGNDVTATDLQHPVPSVVFAQVTPAYVGAPVTVTATVAGSSGTPKGSVEFRLDDNTTVIAPVVNGTASAQFTIGGRMSAGIAYRYLGDDTYACTDERGTSLVLTYRKPSISSITPAEANTGALLPVTIAGSSFVPGGSFLTAGVPVSDLQVVSPSEIHATLDLRQVAPSTQSISVLVGTPDLKVYSDPVLLTVHEPQVASAIQFESNAVTASVTARAKTAWLTNDGSFRVKFLTDDDGDGLVRWALNQPVPEDIFSVVDLTSGGFTVRGRGRAVPDVHPLPAGSFVRDTAGDASRVLFRFDPDETRSISILWVRPGLGAWWTFLSDGSDEDLTQNGVYVIPVSKMLTLGDSPAHPAGFAAGDVLVAMPSSSFPSAKTVTVFASRLTAADLASEVPAVLNAIGRDVGVKENDGAAHLRVVRTGGLATTSSVHWRTIDRSGAGVYYTPSSGTLTFQPGDVVKTIDVPLLNDAVYGPSGAFDVVLSDPVGAQLGDSWFVVNVRDDEPAPLVKISGPLDRQVFLASPNATADVPIELTLTGATRVVATVRWQVSSGSDSSGIVTFYPGETRKTFVVHVSGSSALVDINAQLGAQMNDRFVRINTSFVQSRFHTSDVVVGEKGGPAHVVVTLDPPLQFTSVFYTTVDGTAKAGKDYTKTSGTLTFPAGTSSQTINIPILDDNAADGDKLFTVSIASGPTANVVIQDAELTSRPRLSIASAATVAEGSDATAVGLEVRLSEPSAREVRVRYRTEDRSAIAGADYQGLDQTLTFAAGETVKTISVPVFGDTLPESDKTFVVTLYAAENATVENASATVTIVDDDVATTPRPRPGGH